MSALIFPSSLLGVDVKVRRTPFWNTLIQTAASGKEVRAQFFSAPRYRYTVPLNFARVTGFSAQTLSNEMATINALFHSVMGAWDSFLFIDPYSNIASSTACGAGTGSAGQTTQLKDIEGYPIYDLNGTPSIFVNGVLKTLTTDYTVSATGLVTWVTNPGNGLAITWSGGYYRRCRFDMDEFEMEQIVNLCWGNASLKLISVK